MGFFVIFCLSIYVHCLGINRGNLVVNAENLLVSQQILPGIFLLLRCLVMSSKEKHHL